MPAPALSIPVRAKLDDFKKGMDEAKSHVGQATRTIVKQFVQMNSDIAADLRVTTALTTGLGASLRGLLGPLAALAGGFALVVGGIKAMSAITDLAKERLDEYTEIAKKAAAAGVGIEFFQRQTQAAKTFGVAVDDVSAAFEKLKSETADTLGGSAFTNRLNELVEAGNFKNNAGVGAFGLATNSEQRFKAVVQLITEAANQGERLAAIDLASRFLPQSMLDRLRASGDFLEEMQRRAEAVAATKIVSEEQVVQAADLKKRLEEAQQLLADRFKPIQDDLVKLGLNYHESWVSIVEQIAGAVEEAGKLYQVLKTIPDIFAKNSFQEWLRGLVTPPTDEEARRLGLLVGPEAEKQPARDLLARRLRNPAAITAAQREATGIQSAVRGDTSKQPEKPAPTAGETKDDFDRTVESIQRHIAAMEADAEAIGKGAGAQAEFRAEAALTQALLRAGIEIDDEYAAKITKIAEEAGKTAERLQKLRDIEPLAKFAADAQNAEKAFAQLSLGAFRSFEDNFADVVLGTKTVADAFKDMANSIIRDLIRIAVRQSITGPLAGFLFGGLSGGTGGGGALGGLFGSIFGGNRAGGGEVEPGKFYRVNENTPRTEWFVPQTRGTIVTHDDMKAAMGGGQSSNVVFNVNVAGDVSPATIQRLEDSLSRVARQSQQTAKAVTSVAREQTYGVRVA